MTESEIEIEIDLAPIRYKIKLDDANNFDKEMKKLKSFIDDNDVKLQQVASEALEARRKRAAKLLSQGPVECKLPDWFYKADKISVPGAMALFLYFADRPLNMKQLTDLVNKELKGGKKRDLRNISRHITSKGWALYGLTTYDKATQTYALNEYGRKWVENELIPSLKTVQKDTDNNA